MLATHIYISVTAISFCLEIYLSILERKGGVGTSRLPTECGTQCGAWSHDP